MNQYQYISSNLRGLKSGLPTVKQANKALKKFGQSMKVLNKHLQIRKPAL